MSSTGNGVAKKGRHPGNDGRDSRRQPNPYRDLLKVAGQMHGSNRAVAAASRPPTTPQPTSTTNRQNTGICLAWSKALQKVSAWMRRWPGGRFAKRHTYAKLGALRPTHVWPRQNWEAHPRPHLSSLETVGRAYPG